MKNKFLILLSLLIFNFSCKENASSPKEKSAAITVEKKSLSKVDVPKFDDKELEEFVKEYDEFMNQALNLYDDYSPGSQESINQQNEYLKDSEIYHKKLSSMVQEASSRDVVKFQEYLLAKQQEMQTATEKMINESLN